MKKNINLGEISPAGGSLISFANQLILFLGAINVIHERKLKRYDSIALIKRTVKRIRISEWIHGFHGDTLRSIHTGCIKQITGSFNGIELRVDKTATVKSVSSYFMVILDNRRKVYQNSPEAKQKVKEWQEKQIACQKEANAAVEDLQTLDFADNEQVLDLLCRMVSAVDKGNAQIPVSDIIQKFNEHGFVVGMNVGVSFDTDTEDDCAKYIIGQTLDCLINGGPIHLIEVFTERWKERFTKIPG